MQIAWLYAQHVGRHHPAGVAGRFAHLRMGGMAKAATKLVRASMAMRRRQKRCKRCSQRAGTRRESQDRGGGSTWTIAPAITILMADDRVIEAFVGVCAPNMVGARGAEQHGQACGALLRSCTHDGPPDLLRGAPHPTRHAETRGQTLSAFSRSYLCSSSEQRVVRSQQLCLHLFPSVASQQASLRLALRPPRRQRSASRLAGSRASCPTPTGRRGSIRGSWGNGTGRGQAG